MAPTPPAARVQVRNAEEGYDSTVVGGLARVALNTGAYDVQVSLAGPKPWNGSARVLGNQETVLTPDLPADVGDLWITSEPSGASVSAYGRWQLAMRVEF